jgi:site-specific recombinase XerD
VADEAPLDVVRDVLGHASIATTSVYLSSEMRRRAEALEAVAARRRSRSSH